LIAPRIAELPDLWRAEAERLRRYGGAQSARALRAAADDLERAFRVAEAETLSLAQAAGISGLTVDALAKRVRRGELTNAGRHGKPRLLAAELPRKGGVLRKSHLSSTDRARIARSVVDSHAPQEHNDD
jgi:hypothetical protein